jgi:hypothetical protein
VKILLIKKEVGNCAIHLGVELGISMAAIEEILFKYQKSMFKQTFGVMEEWKSSSKVNPTILVLMKAFQSAIPSVIDHVIITTVYELVKSKFFLYKLQNVVQMLVFFFIYHSYPYFFLKNSTPHHQQDSNSW